MAPPTRWQQKKLDDARALERRKAEAREAKEARRRELAFDDAASAAREIRRRNAAARERRDDRGRRPEGPAVAEEDLTPGEAMAALEDVPLAPPPSRDAARDPSLSSAPPRDDANAAAARPDPLAPREYFDDALGRRRRVSRGGGAAEANARDLAPDEAEKNADGTSPDDEHAAAETNAQSLLAAALTRAANAERALGEALRRATVAERRADAAEKRAAVAEKRATLVRGGGLGEAGMPPPPDWLAATSVDPLPSVHDPIGTSADDPIVASVDPMPSDSRPSVAAPPSVARDPDPPDPPPAATLGPSTALPPRGEPTFERPSNDPRDVDTDDTDDDDARRATDGAGVDTGAVAGFGSRAPTTVDGPSNAASARRQKPADHPVFRAIRRGRVAEAAALLAGPSGSFSDAAGVRDAFGNTPLIVAAQFGRKRVTKMCVRAGADLDAVNRRGHGALHYCYSYGNFELGEYLVHKGARASLRDADGKTPFDLLEGDEAKVRALEATRARVAERRAGAERRGGGRAGPRGEGEGERAGRIGAVGVGVGVGLRARDASPEAWEPMSEDERGWETTDGEVTEDEDEGT